MKKTIIRSKEQARQKAIDWQLWASGQDLSYSELADWEEYFLELAERFNLKEEFSENCII